MGIKFAEPTTEDTQTQLQAQRNRERDDDLKALDALTEPKIKEWEAAGKPVPFVTDTEGNEQPNPFAVTMRLAVPKDQVADFKQNMVRRSALLYGADPIYYANAGDAEGFTAVKWTFTDHMTDSQKKKAAEAAKAAQAKAAEGNGEQPPAEGTGDQEGSQEGSEGDQGAEQGTHKRGRILGR